MKRLATITLSALLAVAATLALPGSASAAEKPRKQPAAVSEVCDEGTAALVLGQLRDGLESHSSRLFLGAFDREKMADYGSFSDQVSAGFQRSEGFRVTFRLLEINAEGEHATVLASFQMESTPGDGSQPSRREAQLRFVLVRTEKGWKITELDPRGFFF